MQHIYNLTELVKDLFNADMELALLIESMNFSHAERSLSGGSRRSKLLPLGDAARSLLPRRGTVDAETQRV